MTMTKPPPPCSRTLRRITFGLAWLAASAAGAMAAEAPAERLFRLVPADAGLTLAVEGLRDQARELADSSLAREFRRLPAAQAWLASDRFRALARAVGEVEATLHVPARVLRDEVLGDAVVLALRPGPADKPDQARGLLLALPRDRAVVGPLMKALDDAQIRAGELAGVEEKSRGKVRYAVRTFRANVRPSEYYALIDSDVFAWSNSEELLLGVIDRKLAGVAGLGEVPAFRKVRQGLGDRPFASVYLDPRLVVKAMAEAPRPAKPADERLGAMLGRYVAAVEYAGASLQLRDGLTLQTHEAIDPARLDPWLRRWLTRPSTPSGLANLVPESALAVVSTNLDPESIRDVLRDLIPEDERPGLQNLGLVLRGILLGLDPVGEVLPRLGPGALLYVDSRPGFPLVGVLDWQDRPEAADLAGPLDNALRTALAIYALDPKRKAAGVRIDTRGVGEARVTTLTAGVRPLLSFRVDPGRVVLGNVPQEVARFGAGSSPPFLVEARSKSLAGAETFAAVDLERLGREVRNLRGPIARRLAARSGRSVDAVDADLGRLLALTDLFRAATFWTDASPGATEIHRALGLIAR